jgi:hypothetical protein
MFRRRKIGDLFALFVFGNDPLIASNDDPSGSNHGITLNEAKSNYLKFGACEEEMLQYVRPPKSSEKGRS